MEAPTDQNTTHRPGDVMISTRSPLFRSARAALLLALVAVLLSGPSWGQEVFAPTEEVDFDRPEAWAMKLFSSVTGMSSFGGLEPLRAGQVDLQLEIASVPDLDERQRRVGFNGLKEENLNRTEIFGRPRARIGLGGGVAATVGYVPPLDIDGVEAEVFSLEIDRSFRLAAGLRLGVGVFAHTADIEGDFTCAAEDAAFPVGSPENLFGCQEKSSDDVQFDQLGLRLSLGGDVSARDGRWHVALGLSRLEGEFQVDALTFGVRDRTRLVTDGSLESLAAGYSLAAWEALRVGAEVLYMPLDVKRPDRADTESDDLVQLRLLVSYGLGARR